jgi:hypothetical protein
VTELGVVLRVSNVGKNDIEALAKIDGREQVGLIGVKAAEFHPGSPSRGCRYSKESVCGW